MVTYGVERREALRIRLTFEEVLLEYQEKLGEEASFWVRCNSRFSTISVPLIFLSVLGSICSMGNMETLGMIDQKVLHEEDPNTNGIEH